jgi:hypothetical protein
VATAKGDRIVIRSGSWQQGFSEVAMGSGCSWMLASSRQRVQLSL